MIELTTTLYQCLIYLGLLWLVMEIVTLWAQGNFKIITDKHYYKLFVNKANQQTSKNPYNNKIITIGDYNNTHITISKSVMSFLFPYYLLSTSNYKGVIFRYSKNYKIIYDISKNKYKPINLIKIDRRRKLKKLKI